MTGAPRGISLEARDLRKTFERGLVTALDGVSLDIVPGERVAIVGRTGSGKSTLLSLLALLDRPDGGTLRIDGVDSTAIASPERWRGENVGIVFQLHHLLPHLTLLENVMLPLPSTRNGARAAASALLGELALGHRAGTLACNVSGGERQLAALARALVAGPRLLLADEPTGNVDTRTGESIVARMFEWSAARGGTLVIVTHDRQLAARCERVITLVDGRVDSDGGSGHVPAVEEPHAPAVA